MCTEGTRADAVPIMDRYALGRRSFSAVPSEAAVVLMLKAIGYQVDHRTDWANLFENDTTGTSVGAYSRGERVTFRARKVS